VALTLAEELLERDVLRFVKERAEANPDFKKMLLYLSGRRRIVLLDALAAIYLKGMSE
jgi:hypothetical protein